MAELSECLCFDLADTLAGNVKALTYLLESTCLAVLETETELKDLSLTVCKGGEHLIELFLEECM